MSANKAGKKKPEKFRERIEFKFVFHATRVPHPGWEKLYVSLESIETGKTTAKTAKSVPQSGACRWPDAIIESTKLTRTNSYDAKLYKFVLGMSPTRVLGEITLNLAEYVAVNSATSYAFPLKSCSSGTVLHIKLQCLTTAENPGTTHSGEPEHAKEAPAEQADQLSEDEDDSSVSSSTNLPPPTPSRDKVLARYNSDSSDVSTPVANGSGKGLYNSPEAPSPPSCATSRLERNGRLRASTESVKSLATPGRAARASLASPSLALDNKEEVARLRQQLADQDSRVSTMEEEVAALAGERDGFKEEVDSLKLQLEDSIAAREDKGSALASLQEETERLRGEKRDLDEVHGNLKLELEDCKHIIKELQQVLAYEKESRGSLDARLDKVQEDKDKLSSTVRELEGALADEREKMEGVSVKNIELQNSLVEQEQTMGEVERVLSQKLQDKEEELSSLQEKLAGLEAAQAASDLVDPNEVVELKEEVEELEADIRELTDENMDLIFKLNIANKELSRFSGETDYLGLTDMEDKLQKFRKEHQSTKDKLAQLESSCKDLKAAKADLESRLKQSLEEIRSLGSDLKASRAMHAADRDAFSGRELRLQEQADEMHEKYSMTFALVADLQTEIEAVKIENSGNRKRKDELEAALGSLEIAKTDLAYRLADLESENLKSRSLVRKYESDMGENAQLLRSKTAKVSDMESKVSMLEAANGELESMIQELQGRETVCTSRIVDLELQVSSNKKDLEAVETRKQELETRVDGLEQDKFELQRMLDTGLEDNKFLKEKLEALMGELAESNALLGVELTARSTAEKRMAELGSLRASLEKQVSRLEDETWQLTERIAGLEAQLSFVSDERETYRMQGSASDNRLKDLENEAGKLQESLAESELKAHGFEVQLAQALEERDCHVHERSKLENRLEDRDRDARELEQKLIAARKSYEEAMNSVEGKLREAVAEAERLNEELRKMARSKAEAEEKSRRTEERAQLEKSAAVERLQAEIQKLTEQMNSTCDEKEHLASQALIEASELRSEKIAWEDARAELEEQLRAARSQAEVLKAEHEEDVRGILSTSKRREREMTSEIEKSVETIAHLEARARASAAESEARVAAYHKLEQEESVVSSQLAQQAGALASLESAKSELETALQALTGERNGLLEDRSSLNSKITELIVEMEQLKRSKAAADERISALQAEQSTSRALEVEQRCESIKLRRQNSEMKQKMSDQEADREELKRRVECLEADVRKRRGGGDENGKVAPGTNGVLARSLKGNAKVGTRESQELVLLRDRVKSLEMELKLRAAESENLKKEIAATHHSVKRSEEQQQQQKDEVAKFPSSQELLQKELQRMQQVNAQLQDKLTRFKESSKWGSTLERVSSLETELAEALESNSMYKEQLRSAFATQQNVHAAALQNLGDVDQVVSSLLGYKRKSSDLETELAEMRERYLSMSLRFAQVEAEREELVMTIRSLRNANANANANARK